MLSFTVPSSIRKVYDQNKDLFIQCGFNYKISCTFLILFIQGQKYLSALARCCPWVPSVSTLSNHICEFKPNRFIRRLQSKILNKYKGKIDSENFCYAIDDTANPKYGKNSYRSYPFHSSSGPFTGQKILVIALVDIKSGFALPLTYSFLTSKKNKDHIKAQDIAIKLMRDVLGAGYPKLPVVTDSWFDSAEYIKNLREIGLDFAGELKSNRFVRTNPGKFVPWTKLTRVFKNVSRIQLPNKLSQKQRRKKRGKVLSEIFGYIKKLGRPLKIIAVYNRKNGVSAFAYYATTDLEMSGAKIWLLSRARWFIECLFRDLKQNLAFGRLSCGGKAGADLSICLPMILYASIRLDGDAIWDKKEKDTVGYTIKKHREKELSKSIEYLLYNQKSIKVSKLKSRRVNLCTKPTDNCGRVKAA